MLSVSFSVFTGSNWCCTEVGVGLWLFPDVCLLSVSLCVSLPPHHNKLHDSQFCHPLRHWCVAGCFFFLCDWRGVGSKRNFTETTVRRKLRITNKEKEIWHSNSEPSMRVWRRRKMEAHRRTSLLCFLSLAFWHFGILSFHRALLFVAPWFRFVTWFCCASHNHRSRSWNHCCSCVRVEPY